jgi:hypothetical protein
MLVYNYKTSIFSFHYILLFILYNKESENKNFNNKMPVVLCL